MYLNWGGGGGGCNVFLTFYAISNISRKKFWEYKTIISHLMFSSCFFVCWNLYPLYPLFPCSDCVSQFSNVGVVWGGGGRGVMFFSHFMLFPTFLELVIQNNYFSFNVFFVFFLYAGNIEKCPVTYSYWLNGRRFLQIVDIWNLIMRLEILKSASSLTG